MNKRLLTLSIVSLLTVGLASCSEINSKKDSNGNGVIVSIDGTDYTAKDLLDAYGETTNGPSTYYNAIYDVLIRNAQEITSDMETIVDNKIDSFVQTVKTNASSNNKTYKAELEDELDDKGLTSLAEYREVLMLEQQKSKYEDTWYADHLSDLTKEYINAKYPYHIKHILVKTGSDTSLYNSKISKDEALKLSSVVKRLTTATGGGNETFGSIAQQTSDDTGSAELYGSLGIMDRDTSFVNEFKLGIYAYDAFFNANSTEETEKREKALGIPSSIDNYYVETSGEGSTLSRDIDIKNLIGTSDSVGQIPVYVAYQLDKYADYTKTEDASLTKVPSSGSYNKQGEDISDTFYPRNVLFNNFFNNHHLSVITDEGSENIEDFNSTLFKAEPKLTGNDSTKVLHDEKGNVILVARAGSGDSYQGVHFMVIEQSPFYYTDSNIRYTSFNTSDEVSESSPITYKDDTAPTLEEYLEYYYSTDLPDTSDTDVTRDQRFVTYLKSNRTTYSSRAEKIKSTVKAYNPNIQYTIFMDLLYEKDSATGEYKKDTNGNYVLRGEYTTGSSTSPFKVHAIKSIDEKVLSDIQTYIDQKVINTSYTSEASNLSTWKSFAQTLKLQSAEESRKVSLENIKLYDSEYKKVAGKNA